MSRHSATEGFNACKLQLLQRCLWLSDIDPPGLMPSCAGPAAVFATAACPQVLGTVKNALLVAFSVIFLKEVVTLTQSENSKLVLGTMHMGCHLVGGSCTYLDALA
jgi:hypothetical protein